MSVGLNTVPVDREPVSAAFLNCCNFPSVSACVLISNSSSINDDQIRLMLHALVGVVLQIELLVESRNHWCPLLVATVPEMKTITGVQLKRQNYQAL